jgi:20S proteasome subunit beta 2
MGSGSLQAMTIFESKYKDNMTREEAVALVTEAISAGIYHDLGSGSHVDYCVITKDKSEMFRNAVTNDKLHHISI